MAEALPIYQFKGKQYFRDDRLHEYRNINNPNDRITYDDVFYGRAKFQKPTLPYPKFLLHSKPRKIRKKVARIEMRNIMETASRLQRKEGLSKRQALTEAWRDAKSKAGTWTKSKRRC